MDGEEPVNGFQLQQGPVLDDEIDPVAAIDVDPLVVYGKRHLASEAQTTPRQIFAQARLVRGLKQTWPESAMHLDPCTDDALRPVLEPSR